MNVDSPEFIDIDLSVAPPDKGKGLVEMPASELEVFKASMPTFEAASQVPLVPRSKWKALAQERMANRQRRNDATYVDDQARPSSCTGMAAAKAAEIKRRRQFGIQYEVRLSGMSVYKQIPGVTHDSGATIKQAMNVLCDVGPLPLNTPENVARFSHTHSMNVWQQQLSAGFEPTANNYRGSKFAVARGLDEIYSAMLLDFVALVGRDGHCVPYFDAAWSTKYDEPFAVLRNSYGPEWGDNGDGYDSPRIVENLTAYVLLGVAASPDLPIPNLDLAL